MIFEPDTSSFIRRDCTVNQPGIYVSDSQILTTLTHKLGQEHPTFAVAMVPIRGGGEIRVGDEVVVD
jgi:uncharacterized protein